MAKKAETLLKEKVQRDLNTLENVWHFKTQEVARRGLPDMVIVYRGYTFFIELKKTAKDKPKDIQRYHLTKIYEAGGFAACICPESWAELFQDLKLFRGEEKHFQNLRFISSTNFL